VHLQKLPKWHSSELVFLKWMKGRETDVGIKAQRTLKET
jgi:hypothetical protein